MCYRTLEKLIKAGKIEEAKALAKKKADERKQRAREERKKKT